MPAARSANATPGRILGADVVAGEHLADVPVGQKGDQLGELRLVRCQPFQGRTIIDPDADSVTGQEIGEVVEMRHDAFELCRLVRHHCNQLMVQLLRTRFGGALVVAFAGLHQQGKHLPEQLGRGPACERDMVRRVVMAGEQSPELSLAQNGRRH